MISICPTITVENKEEYQIQLKTAANLSNRIHIDVSDRSLAPRQLIGIGALRWPKKLKADLHIMSNHPAVDVAIAAHLKPHLVILHAEANADLRALGMKLKDNQIKFGLALLQQSSPALIAQYISELDHVLIFSGNLGYQGGSLADLSLLDKVAWLKQLKPGLEIGWDGGVSPINIAHLIGGGVDVVNVGGFIQHAVNPKQAYAKLKLAISKEK